MTDTENGFDAKQNIMLKYPPDSWKNVVDVENIGQLLHTEPRTLGDTGRRTLELRPRPASAVD